MHFQRYFSLKRNEQTLTVPSPIMNSFPSSVFPSEANWETKSTSLLWPKISLRSGSIYEHKNVYRGRNKVHPIDNEGRLSSGEVLTVLSKQNIKA